MKFQPCDLILLGIPIWSLIIIQSKEYGYNLIGMTGIIIWLIIWLMARYDSYKSSSTKKVKNE